MTRLTFSMADLRPIIEHARSSKSFRAPYGGKARPSLFLVKDQGIYLMSAGLPRQLKPGENEKDGMSVVAYAQGFDPDKDEDFYEAARDAVGGDDFGEALPLDWFTSVLERGDDKLILNASASAISLYRPPVSAATFKVGEKVRLKSTLRDKELRGVTGQVIAKNRTTVTVLLDKLVSIKGRAVSRPVIPAAALEKL